MLNRSKIRINETSPEQWLIHIYTSQNPWFRDEVVSSKTFKLDRFIVSDASSGVKLQTFVIGDGIF